MTILFEEARAEAEKELGRKVDPSLRRVGLLVRGLGSRESRGKIPCTGPFRILLRGEARPCRRIDEQAAVPPAAPEPE
ncbi:MAG: hypothetical protein MI919_08085 [Holophagales bacterium]|nr:hypothetical protein [Holophagales bacterium]